MANVIITPNMNLPNPVPGVDPGPDYANNLSSSLNIIDVHNHSPGSGVPVVTSGININSDLPMNGNGLTALGYARFIQQNSALSGPFDLNEIYNVLGDLYYNDGAGNQVRITQNGSVSGAAGTITGLPSGTASASFNSGSGTFVFIRSTGAGASMDTGALIIRYPGSYPSPAGNFVAIRAPTTLATGYSFTLPGTTPVSSGAMLTSSSTGVLSYTNVDGTTVSISGGVLGVPNGGISSAQLATGIGTAEMSFELNGNYGFLTTPSNQIDGLRFINSNIQILNAWAWIKSPGSSGTTTMDIKMVAAPGGTFVSIFSTLPSFASTAGSAAYVDANGVVSPGTGVTAPALSITSIPAGSALRLDLTATMVDPDSCGITIVYKGA